MVKDLVKNLCVSLETDIGGVSGATSRKVVVATPVITLTGNSVTITCDTTGATIYYTLDGSTPTSGSTQYSAAFTLDSSCTIKAIAIKGGKSSGIAEEEYVKPVTYLTQWKIVGNSEVHGQEIWSCGEYNATDGKWHILVQPQGGSIADIALTEPLRKVNNIADTIEFADGVATLTRNIKSILIGDRTITRQSTVVSGKYRWMIIGGCLVPSSSTVYNVVCVKYVSVSASSTRNASDGIATNSSGEIVIYDDNYSGVDDANNFKSANTSTEVIFILATPTTELVDAPQIEEADSYSMVISQGGKAVEWSSFETD